MILLLPFKITKDISGLGPILGLVVLMDDQWSVPAPLQQAVYTNLPPGPYTFRVQAFAETEKKSSIETVSFMIDKPFWLTWWAFTLYAVLAICLIWGITISQMRRVRRKADHELLIQQQFLDAAKRFVPGEFLEYLNRRSLIDIQIGDCIEANMSILFADLRSFTTLSEAMTPEEKSRMG